jgi:hypothetical protein
VLPPIASLRLHPRLMNHRVGRPFPALIAAVSSPSGDRIVGLHRTWLHPQVDGRVDKAPIPDRQGPTGGAKRSIGLIAGNLVPLTRGTGDRPWCDPLPNSLLAIGEGLEDSLSVAGERPTWRTACAISISNMVGLVLPEAITQVVLIVQNDPADSKAAALVPRIIARLQQQGRRVSYVRVTEK